MAKNKKDIKRALITGITGQSGSYLAEILLDKGYEVHGLIRRTSTSNKQRLEHLRGKIQYHYGDMTDIFSLLWVLKKSNPCEVYNLAAQSHVQVSWETPWYTAQTTGIGVLNLLESIRVLGKEKEIKVYQASTSELFSGKEKHKQNENTPKDPVSPYGTAKLYGFQIAKNYREAFGMFVSNGILFNHESPRRGDNFVTKKIVKAVKDNEVRLGNIDARRDWGSAKEYMEMAWLMLQQDKPDDFVIATGETHSVKEFFEWVNGFHGNKIKLILDKEYLRPVDVNYLCGDASKAKRVLKWKPKMKAKELAKWMYDEEIKQ